MRRSGKTRALGLVLGWTLPLAVLGTLAPAAVPGAAAATGCSTPPRSETDLNGDGYDDAVVGDPYASVAGHAGAGAVVVLFGDADCRIGEGSTRRVVTQATAGVPGTAEAGDHFGWAVSIDDVNSDGRADLVIGSPDEDVDGAVDAGSVHVVSFTAGAPGTAALTATSITQRRLTESPDEAGAQFGYAIGTAEDQGDETGSIVAVGAPGALVRTVRAGVVFTFGSLGGGYEYTGGLWQGNDSVGSLRVPGVPETGDRFGASVLVAQLNAPFTGDVLAGPQRTYVVGAPGDHVAGHAGAGSVTAVYRETWAIEQITQDTPGVIGSAESGDGFGSSLAAYGPDGVTSPAGRPNARTLAVGTPGEDVGVVADAGSVTVLASELTGLRGRADLTQDTAGLAGTVERGDHFGASLALQSSGGTSDPVLFVGVPDEDVGATTDAGMVQSLTVAPSGLTPGRSWTENSAGTPGVVAPGSRFGLSVRALVGQAEDPVAISSPYQGSGSVFLTLPGGGHRAWVPGSDGIPRLAGSGRFGWSVGGLASDD